MIKSQYQILFISKFLEKNTSKLNSYEKMQLSIDTGLPLKFIFKNVI
jgi:hypothetical protein